MNTHELMQPNLAREGNSQGVTLSEASPAKASLILEKPHGNNLDRTTELEGALLLVFPIYLLAITAALILLKLLHSSKLEPNQMTSLRQLKSIPCKTCRYFTNNSYLQCAVHPDIALKAEARHCPDYHILTS